MEKILATDLAKSTHVLAIGISTYADPTIEDLPAAEQEASNFVEALCDPNGCAVPPAQTRVLPASATALQIAGAFKDVSASCQEGSLLVIYFSGHAYRDETGIYLCGSHASRQDLSSTSLSAPDLADALSSCMARGILLILDCCVSAGFAENAPEFFRRTQGKDFRVLLAASREDQLSWEVGNGQGTLFSKHLIEIIKGTISVGAHPGEISLIDLVESIDFHLNEDLKVLHPDVPAQEPTVAGAFNRDPILFFHRKNGLAGLTVEKDRVSRSLHRRRIQRLIIGAVVSVAFGFFTYLTWLDKHLYASADENIVHIYRGYPGLGGPGFPRLVWEEPLATGAFRDTSPLKSGGTVIAAIDRPIEPILGAQLNSVATISRMHVDGHDAEARASLALILREPGLSAETSHFAHLLLGEIGTTEDLPALRLQLNDSRPEIRTNSIKAILRLSPREGFSDLANAMEDFDRFDQRSLINEFASPCPDGAQDYFDRAASAGGFNGVYPELTDAAARIGCSMSQDALRRMAPFWPEFELNHLAQYSRLFHRDELSIASGLDPVQRALFLADKECAVGVAKDGATRPRTSVAWMTSVVLLLSPACESDQRVRITLTAQNELVIQDAAEKLFSFVVPPSLNPALGMALIPRLDARKDAIVISFLRSVVIENTSKPLQAAALIVLSRHGASFRPSNKFLTSENLDLRRAAYMALSQVDREAALESLRARIDEQGLIDWPELMYSVKPTPKDLSGLKPFLTGGDLEKQRAAAVWALYGNEAMIHQLAADPTYADRLNASLYLAGNDSLSGFAVPPTSTTFDDFASLVKASRAKRKSMEDELNQIPIELRPWRIRQILEWRGNAFDTSFEQVLTPGLKLWLADSVQ